MASIRYATKQVVFTQVKKLLCLQYVIHLKEYLSLMSTHVKLRIISDIELVYNNNDNFIYNEHKS